MKGNNVVDYLWDDVICATTYLTNKSPMKMVWGKIHKEGWSRRKPTMSHLRVFGCTTYMHTLKEKRHKFDDKIFKCIFVGYSKERKAYQVYELQTRKVHVTHDVIFNEGDKKIDLGRQMIEEQLECSSSREAEDLKDPIESITMVTNVGDNREVEYKIF